MIWQSPWSALGLATLLLPILIHLLGRGRARVHRFPTLRFIDASRLLPTRRTRLHDLVLLAVRLAILLATVAALAQPLWRATARTRTRAQSLARVIVVDTSASMNRLSRDGLSARTAARTEATRLAADTPVNVIIETADPGAVLSGATAWLARQNVREELVLISDFQRGTIDSAALAALPVDVGVRLVRIDVADAAPIVLHSRVGDANVATQVATEDDRTDVTWSSQPVAPAFGGLLLFSARADSTKLRAASDAALAIGAPLAIDSARPTLLLYPHAAEWQASLVRATALPQPWMTTLALGLHDDPLLRDAAMLGSATDDIVPTAGLTLVRDVSGAALVVAAAESGATGSRLLLFVRADAGSPLSAALIAATRRMLGTGIAAGELDSATLSDARLAAWQRPATERTRAEARSVDTIEDSDGRWFWLLALVLIGVESWLRRVTPVTEAVPDAIA